MFGGGCGASARHGELVRPTAGGCLIRLARGLVRPLGLRAVVSRPVRQSGPRHAKTSWEQNQERDEPEDQPLAHPWNLERAPARSVLCGLHACP
jgi:hypothetical protein